MKHIFVIVSLFFISSAMANVETNADVLATLDEGNQIKRSVMEKVLSEKYSAKTSVISLAKDRITSFLNKGTYYSVVLAISDKEQTHEANCNLYVNDEGSFNPISGYFPASFHSELYCRSETAALTNLNLTPQELFEMPILPTFGR